MQEDKETYNLLERVSEITLLSIQIAHHIKDYSDTEVSTVIMGILDCLGSEYGRDSVGILKSVSEVFPMTFEQLQESMEGGD